MADLRSKRGKGGTTYRIDTLRSTRGRTAQTYNINSLRSLRSAAVTADLPAARAGEFHVFRAYEGVQLVIEWGVPTGEGYNAVQIRRRLDAWPENINDGVFIVEDAEPFSLSTYSDREVEQYRVYYYAMFVKRAEDDVWVTSRYWRGKEFPLPTRYFTEAIWTRLPGFYHREDGEA